MTTQMVHNEFQAANLFAYLCWITGAVHTPNARDQDIWRSGGVRGQVLNRRSINEVAALPTRNVPPPSQPTQTKFPYSLDRGFFSYESAEGFADDWQTVVISEPGTQFPSSSWRLPECSVTVADPQLSAPLREQRDQRSRRSRRAAIAAAAVVPKAAIGASPRRDDVGEVGVHYVPGITAMSKRRRLVVRGNGASTTNSSSSRVDDVRVVATSLFGACRGAEGNPGRGFGRGGGGGVVNRVTRSRAYTVS